jgi:hypothetical protein
MFKVGDVIIAIQSNGVFIRGKVGIVTEMDDSVFFISLIDTDTPPFYRRLEDSIYFEKVPPVLEELF